MSGLVQTALAVVSVRERLANAGQDPLPMPTEQPIETDAAAAKNFSPSAHRSVLPHLMIASTERAHTDVVDCRRGLESFVRSAPAARFICSHLTVKGRPLGAP